MSNSGNNAFGYFLVPVVVAHGAVGFLLMIATVFLGIPDFLGVQMNGFLSFLLFLVAIVSWVWAGLCSLNWIISGVPWFLSPPRPDFRLTFFGATRRLVVVTFGWLMVLGLLALVPADRSLMIQPLSLFGERAVPLATWFLHDSSPRVRRSAIEVLYRIGPPARSSAPEIARYLDDPDEQVRIAANSALRTLDPKLLPP